MSTATPTQAKPTRAQALRFPVISAVFVVLFFGLAASLAYPIYGIAFFWVSVAAAVLLGAAIAAARVRFRWNWITTAVVATGVWLIAALPATNPAMLTSFSTIGRGWVESVSSIVFGWKQLVTIDLPVGTYHGLLGPAFAVFYVASVIAFVVVWSHPRKYWLAIIPLSGALIFGLAFGGTTVSSSLVIGTTRLPLSASVLAGIAFVALSVTYLAWAARASRRLLFSSARPTTSRGDVSSRRRQARHFAIAVATVVAAALIAGAVTNAAGLSSTREVLRSSIVPIREISQAVSPLSAYRASFVDSTKLAGTVLTYSPADANLDRIRVAVMPYFDGQEFRVTPATNSVDRDALFRRMPADAAPTSTPTGERTVTIALDKTAQMWLPLIADLKSVNFVGPRSALADSFFFNSSAESGVIVPGPADGAQYLLTGYLYENAANLADVTPQGASTIEPELVPESLTAWLDIQRKKGVDTTTAAGFAKLVDKLRQHTYLSHSLQEPEKGANATVWTELLTGYSFEPSLAGHSVGRLEKLFKALVDRETARPRGNDAQLVAAAADDEQLAAAVALLARVSGFESRVVLGFNTVAGADETLSPCVKGTCTGANLAAWVEISGTSGTWVPMDVTPQHVNKIAPQSQQRQDPKNATDVTPDSASVLPPEPANPAAGASKQKEPGFAFDWAGLWEVLKFIGTVLLIFLILVSPFALVIGAKIRRRRERKNTTDPSRAVIGAWDEYIDTLLDFGGRIPKRSTRNEIAATQIPGNARVLASLADEAAFAPYDPPATAVLEAWDIVDEQRAGLVAERSWWRPFLAWMSLKSFTRHLHPVEQLRRLPSKFAFDATQGSSEGSGFVGFVRYLGSMVVAGTKRGLRAIRRRGDES